MPVLAEDYWAPSCEGARLHQSSAQHSLVAHGCVVQGAASMLRAQPTAACAAHRCVRSPQLRLAALAAQNGLLCPGFGLLNALILMLRVLSCSACRQLQAQLKHMALLMLYCSLCYHVLPRRPHTAYFTLTLPSSLEASVDMHSSSQRPALVYEQAN